MSNAELKQMIGRSARLAFPYGMGPARFAKLVTSKRQKITRKNAKRMMQAFQEAHHGATILFTHVAQGVGVPLDLESGVDKTPRSGNS